MNTSTPTSPPVVDLAGDPAWLASRFTTALIEHGCAWVVNHGVAPQVCEAVYAESLAFFALPRAEKASVEWSGSGLWRGWQPIAEGGAEYGGEVAPTELLERLEANLSPIAGGPDSPDNLWPSRPSSLRPAWEAYADGLSGLTSRLVALLAEGLDLPGADLPAWTRDQFSNVVANFYPAQPTPPEEGRMRVRPHVDHGGLTVLLFDAAPGGLQSRVGGEWVDVAPLPGGLLVQAGELLARWTAGVVRANVHQVVNPPREHALRSRMSIVYFHHPDLDSMVAPAPSCLRADTRHYSPVLARDLVFGRQHEYRGVA